MHDVNARPPDTKFVSSSILPASDRDEIVRRETERVCERERERETHTHREGKRERHTHREREREVTVACVN